MQAERERSDVENADEGRDGAVGVAVAVCNKGVCTVSGESRERAVGDALNGRSGSGRRAATRGRITYAMWVRKDSASMDERTRGVGGGVAWHMRRRLCAGRRLAGAVRDSDGGSPRWLLQLSS